jgi:hypothetical protein
MGDAWGLPWGGKLLDNEASFGDAIMVQSAKVGGKMEWESGRAGKNRGKAAAKRGRCPPLTSVLPVESSVENALQFAYICTD